MHSDLCQALKSVVNDNIDDYALELWSNEKGQGFVAEIAFVNLTHHKTKNIQQLIIKQEQKGNESIEELLVASFLNEIRFYDIIWPFLQNFYKNVSGKELNIVPKCFGTSDFGRKRIILENVTPQGYKIYDKSQPFDSEHYRKIFETYGNYHGISMALREKDPLQYKKLVNGQTNLFITIYKDDSHPLCKSLDTIFREIQKYFDPVKEKHILEKIRYYEKFFQKIIFQIASEDFPQGVILHGDCWSNNLMFKYDDHNKVKDMKLLDFQVVCHGTPVFDLSYSIYSGASEKILDNLDDYLQVYYKSLSETLMEFGLSADNLYSYTTFKEEWKKYCKIGFTLGLFIWKLKLVHKDDVPDFSQDLDPVINISGNKENYYKNRIRELTFHMYNNDFF